MKVIAGKRQRETEARAEEKRASSVTRGQSEDAKAQGQGGPYAGGKVEITTHQLRGRGEISVAVGKALKTRYGGKSAARERCTQKKGMRNGRKIQQVQKGGENIRMQSTVGGGKNRGRKKRF